MSNVLFDIPGPKARVRQRIYTVLSLLVFGGLFGWVLWVLWEKEQITPEKWEPFGQPQIIEALAEGVLDTLLIAAVAIALAIVFGVVLASGRLSDRAWIRWPSIVVIEFFRAVPLLLLIFFLFLAYSDVIGRFWALVFGLMLYNGSVLAETFRAGIQSVSRGQSEAAYAVGMRKSQVMRLVLAPQAVRSMLPAIISQCVVCLKDTALGYIIGAPGVVRIGEQIYQFPAYQNHLAVGIVLAAIFIVINYSLSKLAVFLESRMRTQGKQVVHVNPTDPVAV